MRILFVENRYKTLFWDAIAKELEGDGHEVFWIVQNHSFLPLIGTTYKLPYFDGQKVEKVYCPEILKVVSAHRGLNYFAVPSDDHVFYYQSEIKDLLDIIRPDIAFGESTLFHEQLIITLCKAKNILYLHPTSCRYPPGRFSFYQYDTLVPYGENRTEIDDDMALSIANSIASRSVHIDYMTKLIPLGKVGLLKDKWRLMRSYYSGEKFNTPNPFIKIQLDRKWRESFTEWEEISEDNLADEKLVGKFKILYALQLQPEANIDYWGYPFSDQLELLKEAEQSLGSDDVLIVKPNPKSKYELSKELLDFVKSRPKVIPLSHALKMDDVFDAFDLILSVTGTISIEAALANKPVMILGSSMVEQLPSCYKASAVNELSVVLEMVKKGSFPRATDGDKIAYIQEIQRTSFPGINGDGLHNAHYLKDKENFSKVVKAFRNILNQAAKPENS